MVPDFKVAGERGAEDALCELKMISASRSWYPRNPRRRNGRRAVDRRADGLTALYAKKAQHVDCEYGGNPHPPPRHPGAPQPPRIIGRVERRLLTYGRVKGWCFGAWSEASEEVHELVQRVAVARLEIANLQPEHRQVVKSREAELSGLVSFVRRQLSFTAAQQQAKLLLDRLQLLGPGAAEAAARRDQAVRIEAGARAVCVRQGASIMRRGHGLLD